MVKGIRLIGLFATSGGSNLDTLQKHTGYRLVRDGNDWVIPEDDPSLVAGPRDVILFRPKPFQLKEKDYATIASDIAARYLATDLEEHLGKPPSSISVPGGYGLLSDLESIRSQLYFTPRNALERVLAEKVFPFAVSKLGARFMLPVRIDVSYQQALLSIPKISLLIRLFGGEGAGRRIFENNALRSVLPTPVEVLSYLDALLFLCPNALAIPLGRVGSNLYFLGKGAWRFPRTATGNIFEQLTYHINPVVESEISGLLAPPGLSEHGMRTMLMCAIASVNGVMRFLNDPRNFLTPQGEFNQEMNVKAQCSIRLMFADLLAISFTNSFHVKHRMAFQFLDKMANLIRMLSNTTRSEARVFRDLLSESTGHKVASAIRSALEPRSNRVAEILGKSVRLTYNRLHGHIVGDDGGPTLNQEQRTAHLRTLRNLGHGTELFDKKFEETFFGGSPTIPSELVHVPFFLALALGLNPAVVLSPTGDEPKAPTS